MNSIQSQIERLILETVGDVVGRDPATIEPDARRTDKYDLNSPELMEIGARLEHTPMMRIEPERLFGVVSPADVLAYLNGQAVVT